MFQTPGRQPVVVRSAEAGRKQEIGNKRFTVTSAMIVQRLETRMATAADVCQLALLHQGTCETDEGGKRCFRIDGRRFATLHDDRTLHLVLGEVDALPMAEAHPKAYQPLYYDAWLVGLKVALDAAEAVHVAALLDASYAHVLRRSAPASTSGEVARPAREPGRDERRRAARASALAMFRSAAGPGAAERA